MIVNLVFPTEINIFVFILNIYVHMKYSDKFITKWADAAIKLLTLFIMLYVCALFINIKSHYSEFSKGQSEIINNHNILLNLLTNQYLNAQAILKNQIDIKNIQEISLQDQEFIKENQKTVIEFIKRFQTNTPSTFK